ncbi:MAG: 5-oxoprolinase [Candidatus Hydrogenedentota bacterium]
MGLNTQCSNIAGWDFWLDRGGTFTDVVARDPAGGIHIQKLLSENPERYPDAPLASVRHFLGLGPGDPLPADRIRSIRMGTTLATNALLERKGARVGLLTTRGFADLLVIGNQSRPDLFALKIEKPSFLASAVREVNERVLADGSVRHVLDRAEAERALVELRSAGVTSLAVLFLNSYVNPEHELAVGRIAASLGFEQVSLSHAVAREIKAVPRGDTTLVDAYLTPVIRGYLSRLRDTLGWGVPLKFMQSNGGLADGERFSGKDAILSGPAGGVVACAHVAVTAGFEKAIGFDMGGTSTDVSRFDGSFDYVFEKPVAGVRIKAPMMDIETVAAGGGSVLSFDGRRYTVGPESAGAVPGPASYRRGGPATVTDANVLLGRIQPKYFPACFGRDAQEPLDAEAARRALSDIARAVSEATGSLMTPEAVAAGFVRIANENMAKPIKEISVSRGYDVQEYALVCFGGAGGQHACALADLLGIRTVVVHPFAGVLSAYGMGLADTMHSRATAMLKSLTDESLVEADSRFAVLERELTGVLGDEGFDSKSLELRRSADLRYAGTDTPLNVAWTDDGLLLERFVEAHTRLYGYSKAGHAVEIVALRVEAIGHTDTPVEALCERAEGEPVPVDWVSVWFDLTGADGMRRVEAVSTPVYPRVALCHGHCVNGPALIVEEVSTIVLERGWTAEVNAYNHLLLRAVSESTRERVRTERDPVMLEIFNNLFMSIADQMGRTLERVSHSVNIKERLDFSCAVFTGEGDLVANAPHIPVHLGAMGESVKAVIEACGGTMQPGDVYATNDPYHGGSHLPDVTVVTPVFSGDGACVFLVANRGHHADIGGITPGSMPPFSRSLDEEGVVIRNVKLVARGCFDEAGIVKLLSSGPYPARNMDERLSDLRAQLAANSQGVALLHALCAKYTLPVVRAYMRHVRDNAAESMREVLGTIGDGVYRFEDSLDCGATIRCAVTIKGESAVIDFAGTDPQLDGNLNARPAVVKAACLYVMRTLIGKPIPLNGGCLDPIEIRIPEGSLLNPRYPAAVVGGNVETSQRVCDVLYGALGVLAAGQGTMNNFSFGTERFGYYETIGGGAGAGSGFHGASGVHVHMTNTRITDPEVLEHRYPVVVREFALRKETGGKGQWRGGDGTRRSIEFLEGMHVTLLTERRVTCPYGMHGGEPGQPGRNALVRNGETHALEGRAAIEVAPGDVLVIETPGGGGYGKPVIDHADY